MHVSWMLDSKRVWMFTSFTIYKHLFGNVSKLYSVLRPNSSRSVTKTKMCQFLHTSSSSSTCWHCNLFAPEIAAPKSANLGKLKSPICCRFEEKGEKLTHSNYKSNVIELNTKCSDKEYQ